jgi:2-oxoisovalerate dehydrogenase E2 component (dihydrolipoyl transacylase)
LGRYVVKLPDLGEGMTEAEIVAWHVKPGQVIREEDPLVEIMTDKATVELPAPSAGTVLEIHGTPGERRPVGSELVVLDVAGAGNAAAGANAAKAEPPRRPLTPALSPQAGRGSEGQGQHPTPPHPPLATAGGPASPAVREREPEPAPSMPLSRRAGEGGECSEPGEGAAPARPPLTRKPLASPAVRRRAWDSGVELQFVAGSGPGGRITQGDLDAYLARGNGSAAPPAAQDTVEDVPVVGLRRVIAERMQQAKRQIPHFSYVEETDVTALEELRRQLNALHPDREHLTLLPLLMRALVLAVAAHPQVNARYDDAVGILHRHRAVHLGVATQTEGGLMVPVVRHAEALDLWQSAAELRRLTQAARAGKATREELAGSTITITSLGRLGGIAATPVINYPEVAIVGVNRIVERPVVHEHQIAVRRMMNLSSSFDHRIVDGWEAASFIQRIKQLLEQPALLFVG